VQFSLFRAGTNQPLAFILAKLSTVVFTIIVLFEEASLYKCVLVVMLKLL
jgi:hypothetical protein